MNDQGMNQRVKLDRTGLRNWKKAETKVADNDVFLLCDL